MMKATFVSAGKGQHSGEGRPRDASATRRARGLAALIAARGLLACLLGALAACAGPAPKGKPVRSDPPPVVEGPNGLTLAVGAGADETAIAGLMPGLARRVLERYQEGDRERHLSNLFRLQMVAGAPAEARYTLASLRALVRAADPVLADGILVHDQLYATAKAKQATEGVAFEIAFERAFREHVGGLDDKGAYYVAFYLRGGLGRYRGELRQALAARQGRDAIELPEALELVRKYEIYQTYAATAPLAARLIAEDDARRYAIQDDVLIKTNEGATLSATVFRPARAVGPGPAALFFSIYTDASRDAAREAAAHGYVGVAVESRGKRLSPDAVAPYEHEVSDVNAAVEWVSHQPWSDGQVGMWGNSYAGFSQWAAAKGLHPALKTIVPSAAAVPGFGLPMENNVFLNANYGWAFYVTNHKLLDDAVYNDGARWSSLTQRWYESGRPYREIDAVDGTPNPFLQRWLRHPAYDAYWQRMVPGRGDYAKIKLPVLTITGYYDDGQISALHYLKEHYKYNPRAEHYLLVGPYDHFGAQSPRKAPTMRGYELDQAARINTKAVIFQWLDHVLRGGPKPALLKDKINYQVMGANEWRHAPSLEAMGDEALTLYLSDATAGAHHALARQKPTPAGWLEQKVDLADRSSSTNDYYYPSPIVSDKLELAAGFSYVSEPFDEPVAMNGLMTGELKVTINKRDVDLNVVLYELMPDGRLFHLSYFLGRASYAKDMSVRTLLTPGRLASIPFERSRLVSRRLGKGSRLLAVVNVNKNPFAQVNHGTGKDVSDESSADAGAPLTVRWHTGSYLKVPISRAAGRAAAPAP